MGEKRVSRSSENSPRRNPKYAAGHTLMAELVASGEIPLAATLYNHNASGLVVKGAPIRWKALNPPSGRRTQSA